MSRSLSKADAIAAHLATLPDLAGMDISVHRQDDLLTQVNAAFEKAAGQGCVVVKWLGGKNPERKSSKLRIGARYSISLWTYPVLNEGQSPDGLVEAIAEHLHGFYPNPAATACRLEVESFNIVPDAPGYMVHEILAEMSNI